MLQELAVPGVVGLHLHYPGHEEDEKPSESQELPVKRWYLGRKTMSTTWNYRDLRKDVKNVTLSAEWRNGLKPL